MAFDLETASEMSRLTQEQKEVIHEIIVKKLKLGPSLAIIKGAIDDSVRSTIPDTSKNESGKVRECLDFLSDLGAVSVADPLKAFLVRAADSAPSLPDAETLRKIADSLPDPSRDLDHDHKPATSEVQLAREFRTRMITANNQQLRLLLYEIEKALLTFPKGPELSELRDRITATLAAAPHIAKSSRRKCVCIREVLIVATVICIGILTWSTILSIVRSKPELTLDDSTLREAELSENEAMLNRSIQALLNSKSASELDLVLTGSTFPVETPLQSPEFSVRSSLEGAQIIVDGVLAVGELRSAVTVVPPKLTTQPVVIKVNGKLTKNSRILFVIGVKLSASSPLHQSTPLERRTEIKKSIQLGNVP